ncbi:nucleoporin-domain-containing protein [Xylariaceae sp. FL0255]|nr:nucleoporin-domain-containing protein [Xylariaceae sp. FL0255]
MAFPATPSQNLPGAFLHTPAVASRFGAQQDPVVRRLFGPVPAGGTSQPPPLFGQGPANALDVPGNPLFNGANTDLQTAAATPQPPLAKAASFINNALARDEQFPELDTYCRQLSSLYDVTSIDAAWAPFQMLTKHAIPQSVFEQYNRSEVSTMMGLFAELNHAWITIDNCLYLWDYTRPNPELIGYEDCQQSITAIKLVAPKKGVFNDVINHILVVATKLEMVLLGVSAKTSAAGTTDIELYGTKMSLSTRGTEANLIAGSKNGRIFFTGPSESDVYELAYQQEEKWFTSRTSKINHANPGWGAVVPTTKLWGKVDTESITQIVVDDTRNLLYTLSNRSTVRTYHMQGQDKLTKVIEKSKADFMRDIGHMSGPSPLLNEQMQIVSISPISATEDSKVHLVAVTNTGCRLFASATSGSPYSMIAPGQAPTSMQLQAIRFPPPETKQRRSRVDFGGEQIELQSRALETSRHGVRFAPGYFLDFVATPQQPNKDRLFLSAPDSGRINNRDRSQPVKYFEQATWVDLDGRIEDVGLVSPPFAAIRRPLGFGNELAVQFDDPNGSEFAVLTNDGIHILRRRRLVDMFASAIRSTVGDEGLKAEVSKFQHAYGRVETITAALVVACRQGDSGRYNVGRTPIDQPTLDRAKQVFINFGGNPRLPEQDGQPATVEMVRPSSRHGAITLYLSRLIRSLWKSNVISVSANAGGGLAVNSTISRTRLKEVQDSIIALKNFLNDNRSFIQGLSGPSDLRRAASKQEELMFQGEHQAMHAIEVLMTDIVEGISFVMTLFDERVVDIFTRLNDQSRQELRDLTFERLFSQAPGKELAKVLVKAIVNRNIENGSNVETVADALRRKCGSFCSADDVVIFKAQEQLKKASDPSLNQNVHRALLHDSLKHFQKVASSLTEANLQSAIQQYVAQKYYAGAIALCLSVADTKDRGKSALYWINDGKPAGDPRQRAFEQRKACYEFIYQVLLELDAAHNREPETIDGKPTLIATKYAEAYEVVSNSTDEVFHQDLYDWYLQQGWSDRLLAIQSNYVITFLRRLASTDVAHADLLCRFYTNRQNYFEAAKVQSDLARSDFPISIKDRLHLLSRAKTNASVMTTGVSRQEQQLLNHEVTELLDVAHIQDDLLERLKEDERIPPERQLEIQKALDGQIQALSELFNNYADQAGYYDLCLVIYHVADFRNPTTIAQTWSNLIQQTHDNVRDAWARYNEEGDNTLEQPPQPYESLIAQIEEICHRSSNDSFIFPVPTLLPDLCRYAYENGQDGRSNADVHWPVDIFLSLGISHDLVVRVLESMFEAQEIPFRGNGRGRIVEWITHVVDLWIRDLGRHGRPEARLEPWVGELMAECDTYVTSNPRANNEGGADPRDLSRAVKDVRRAVEGLIVNLAGNRSMGFF